MVEIRASVRSNTFLFCFLFLYFSPQPASRSCKAHPFCVVKWRGMELGRTQICSDTCEPDWGHETFQLALSPDPVERLPPLILEVWNNGVRGAQADFLGQVQHVCAYLFRGRCIDSFNCKTKCCQSRDTKGGRYCESKVGF